MAINRHMKLNGSNIDSVGYDVSTRTLEVVFNTDPSSVYRYKNVDAEMFAKLVNAESVGFFFAKNIRPHTWLYPYEKVAKTETLKQTPEERSSDA